MPHVIDSATAERIKYLLFVEKRSQHAVSRITGVSRGVIGGIASGKRPDFDEIRRQKQADSLEPSGPPVKCPGCGYRIYMPCRICRTRAYRSTHPPPKPSGNGDLD